MSTAPHLDEVLIRRMRANVATGLTERTTATATASGRRLDTDDQTALARRLINEQLNLQLPDGSRLFATAWVCGRPCLAIRRHRYLKVDLADLEGLGAIDRGLSEFLAAAIRARKQLMIGGATGAGKTTMLRALASE